MSHSLTRHGCCLSFWQAASIVESLMNLHPILLALCMPASAFFRKNFQTKYGTGPLQCQHQLFSEKTSKQNMVLDLFNASISFFQKKLPNKIWYWTSSNGRPPHGTVAEEDVNQEQKAGVERPGLGGWGRRSASVRRRLDGHLLPPRPQHCSRSW